MSQPTLIGGNEAAIAARAKSHPIVDYKGVRMEWDEYDQGERCLHIVCPRCACFGLIDHRNKRFTVDDRGLVSIDEPFRCDYCHWRFGVKDGRMFDA